MTQPFMLLPGWGLGRGPLQPLCTALHGQLLDLPGYGATAGETASATPEPPPDWQSATRQLAEGLPTGVILGGWSLGAQLALAIARHAPEKVAGLVLIAGTPSFIQRPHWSHALPPEMLDAFVAGVRQDFSALLPRFVGGFNRGDAQAKSITRSILDSADPPPSLDTLLTGLAWLRDIDLCADLPHIDIPTLLIHGAADPLMPVASAEAMAAQLPRARLHLFAECAHAPFLSHPTECPSLIQAFLDDPRV